MPRVVPSQVVEFIKHVPRPLVRSDQVRMSDVGPGYLSAVVDLADQIPDYLLTMDGPAYASFTYAKALIRHFLRIWVANRSAGHGPDPFDTPISANPVIVISDALAKCPDESPSPSTSDLGFIPDMDLRHGLRGDMGAINRALSNGEWKAATVLAGSVIESLLLWALQKREKTDPAAVATAIGTPPKLSNKPLDEWHLPEYIDLVERLKIVTADTVTQVKLAKEFRNLIHPGRAQRLRQKCDRATALAAVAGMELVVRDIPRHP